VTTAPGYDHVLTEWQAAMTGTRDTAAAQNSRSGHWEQFAKVLSSLRDGTPPPVPLAESRRTLSLVAALYASSAAGHPVKPSDVSPGTPFYDSMAGQRPG
jgi:hypothetical protein